MKKINTFGFMSLLALMGIIGLVTPNKGFLGFFGFASYFRYFWVIPDEMFAEMVRKAGSRGFFSGLGVTVPTAFLSVVFPEMILSQYVFAAGFIVSMLVFSITLVVLEFKEARGIQ